jgi:hypothetical protein
MLYRRRRRAPGAPGCTCKPSYSTLYRDKLGRPTKGSGFAIGGPPKQSATALEGAVDAKRLGLQRTKDVIFSEWVDRWIAGLERAGGDERKENTKRDYRWMAEHAKATFGAANLSELTRRPTWSGSCTR